MSQNGQRSQINLPPRSKNAIPTHRRGASHIYNQAPMSNYSIPCELGVYNTKSNAIYTHHSNSRSTFQMYDRIQTQQQICNRKGLGIGQSKYRKYVCKTSGNQYYPLDNRQRTNSQIRHYCPLETSDNGINRQADKDMFRFQERNKRLYQELPPGFQSQAKQSNQSQLISDNKNLDKPNNKRHFTSTNNIDSFLHIKDIQKTEDTSSGMSSRGQKYSMDGIAGKGTFGVVYFGKDLANGQRIAHKKVMQDKKYKNRQLQILKQLQHPNIIRLREFYTDKEDKQQYLNLIMDFFPEDLSKAIKNKPLNQAQIKIYLYQIFKGLEYLASLNIAHRDIKPHNILIDNVSNKAVICDFGSAKKLVKEEKNLAYICSRCYRACQLIFGATDYTSQVDMWAVGCIMVEMINGKLPFLAQSQANLFVQIVKILGTPTDQDAYDMNPNYDKTSYNVLPKIKSKSWNQILHTDDKRLINLVSKVLVYSPKKRLTPSQAIKHPYFDQLRSQDTLRQIQTKVGILPTVVFGLGYESIIVNIVGFNSPPTQKIQETWTNSDNEHLLFNEKFSRNLKLNLPRSHYQQNPVYTDKEDKSDLSYGISHQTHNSQKQFSNYIDSRIFPTRLESSLKMRHPNNM